MHSTPSGALEGHASSAGVLLLGLAVFSLAGCFPGWREVAPPGAGFSVSMPSDVSCEETPSLPEKPGDWNFHSCSRTEPIPTHHFIFRATVLWYFVSWSTVPERFRGESIESIESLLKPRSEPRRESKSALIQRLDRERQATSEKNPPKHEERTGLLGGVHAIEYESLPSEGDLGFKARSLVCLHEGTRYAITVMGEGGPELERIWQHMKETFVFLPRNKAPAARP